MRSDTRLPAKKATSASTVSDQIPIYLSAADLGVTVLTFLVGVGGTSGASAIAAAVGLGALAAGLLCLGWYLWLHP
ncbi:hypothetical protein [Nocardia flavorosea]|uniref:Uncharacterized protein n=1 Tax=Nocardia flavorosea TaxID=53429 RepID=A0A846YIU9_9NOCA|nr:hypothetical protein [Nocardia flavorosea]NKY58795.1 hypothetical protein [Nocardia flavorosea]